METSTSLKMGEEYSKFALVQKKYNSRAATILVEKIEKQHLEDPPVFSSKESYNIADLGCADGVNSIPVLEAIIEKVRELNPDKKISLYLNDTPHCDLTKAIKNIGEAILQKYKDVTLVPIGESFYNGLFPEASQNLIYCITSIHMLSEPAPTTHDHWVFYLSKDMPPINENTKKWVELGEKDWSRFLMHREKELKAKGILYVSTHTINKEGTVQSEYMLKISLMTKSLLRELLKKYGWEEHEKMLTLPVISRRLEDYLRPIEGKKSALNLVFSEVTVHKDSTYERLKSDIATAKEHILCLTKAYFNASLKEKLLSKGAPIAKVEEFLTEFFSAYSTKHIICSGNVGYGI